MVKLPANLGLKVAKMVGNSAEFDAIARQMLARCVATAPTEHGDYRNSFGFKRVKGRRNVSDRLVYNTSTHARYVEFGGRSSNGTLIPAHYTMVKAAHGLRKEYGTLP